MATRKPQPGRVNEELIRYLGGRVRLPGSLPARSVSKFRAAEQGEREASERQRASLARAATRAYYERNTDKVRAATRAYYQEHKDKWRTVYAENRRRAALRAARNASSETGTKAAASAATAARASGRAKGVSLA